MEPLICTICARGGSQGVPGKNLKLINGKPLIAYTIEFAKKSGYFEDIVIIYGFNRHKRATLNV